MGTTAVEKKDTAPPAPNGTDPDAGSLMQLAIEREVPVEILERLMDLHERVSDRNARAAFIHALAAFQDECPPVLKSREASIATRGGESYTYSYAPLDRMAVAIRPHLTKHGLSYSWDSEVTDGLVRVTCILRHQDGHSERATFASPTDTKAAMSDAQKHAAALTFGRRQSLVQVLGLTVADDDFDGVAEEPVEMITDEQLADLELFIDEVGASREKICEWLGVNALSEMTEVDLERLTPELEARKAAT